LIGVNLAGAEFGSHRGVYGTDYTYPTASELDYYQSRGIDLIRLPFAWERMQPVLGGVLDPAELGRMTGVLDAAAERGMMVVIDLHNYARYDGQLIGSSAVPIAAFQNFWTRLASAVSDHPAIWGFGIMNEPHDMGGAQVWPTAAQAAVNGIRSTGSRETIIVSGDGWSGAHSWQQINAHLNVRDPVENLMYEAHVYFDRNNSGVYAGGYDVEGAYPMVGVDRIQPFLNWLAANNFRGFIGEYGVPDNDPRWLAVLENFLRVLDEKDMPSAYWAGGPWWGCHRDTRKRHPVRPRSGQRRDQRSLRERSARGPEWGRPSVWRGWP
jgi:endoglucanase